MQKQQNKKLVPKLRFKEFEGEWRSLYFKEMFKFVRSNSFSRNDMSAENGTILNIHYGDIHTKYKTNFDLTNEIVPSINPNIHLNLVDSDYLKEGDLVIADASEDYKDIGKTIEIINLDNKNVVSGLHTIAARPVNISQGFYGNLFKTYTVRRQLMRIANGISVLGISKSNLEGIELITPIKEEQQKIASFLTAVDKRIEQLTRKKKLLEEYKKGVMQKIFNQEIRFKDENGNDFPEWEEKRLGEISKTFSGWTPTSTNREYYVGKIPFIRSAEINSNITELNISEKGLNTSSAKLVSKGDILYALYGATSGEVAISQMNGAINQAILCIRSEIDHYYLYTYLQLNKKNIVTKYIQGGQGNLSAEIIKKLVIPVPSVSEQSVISSLFSKLDQISLEVDMVLAQTKTFKRALLQQMFI